MIVLRELFLLYLNYKMPHKHSSGVEDFWSLSTFAKLIFFKLKNGIFLISFLNKLPFYSGASVALYYYIPKPVCEGSVCALARPTRFIPSMSLLIRCFSFISTFKQPKRTSFYLQLQSCEVRNGRDLSPGFLAGRAQFAALWWEAVNPGCVLLPRQGLLWTLYVVCKQALVCLGNPHLSLNVAWW